MSGNMPLVEKVVQLHSKLSAFTQHCSVKGRVGKNAETSSSALEF